MQEYSVLKFFGGNPQRRHYSLNSNENNTNDLPVSPVRIYLNADREKFNILNDNKEKAGIYRWVNLLTGKTYIGSSRNLSARLKQYFNINYLESETTKNNSNIYRSLIKNGYSNFKIEILEHCTLENLIDREQYYLDKLEPEYNILKKAGSLSGFKHSEATKELMSLNRLNHSVSEETRERIAKALAKGNSTIVKNIKTNEIISFLSLRKAAEYLGIHHSYLAKLVSSNKFYLGKDFLVYKLPTTEEEIYNSEEYKKVSTDSPLKSKNAKPLLLTNNETLETLELPSTVSAAKYLGVSEPYIRKCLTNNKPCKDYTIVRKSSD